MPRGHICGSSLHVGEAPTALTSLRAHRPSTPTAPNIHLLIFQAQAARAQDEEAGHGGRGLFLTPTGRTTRRLSLLSLGSHFPQICTEGQGGEEERRHRTKIGGQKLVASG